MEKLRHVMHNAGTAADAMVRMQWCGCNGADAMATSGHSLALQCADVMVLIAWAAAGEGRALRGGSLGERSGARDRDCEQPSPERCVYVNSPTIKSQGPGL